MAGQNAAGSRPASVVSRQEFHDRSVAVAAARVSRRCAGRYTGAGPPAADWASGRKTPKRAILARDHGASPELRGSLKTFLLFCTGLFLAFQARTNQLAFIVLNTAEWGAGQLPKDWQVKVNHGKPDISVCADHPGACLHLKSVRSSFSLERGVDVDPAVMPYLSWDWKVTQLPGGGDFRRAASDDQAAQLMVAFEDRRVLSYIWDTSAPKGAEQKAGFIPLVHIFAVVCQSGNAEANRWVEEIRNVAADYQRAYGRPAPHVKGLRIQINSQHTGTVAESYFGEVAFRNTSR
jgi:hypothetical protein